MAFKDPLEQRSVAVKKITDAYFDVVDGKRILREVKLLRHLHHDNIIQILDMYPPEHPDHDVLPCSPSFLFPLSLTK